jgi:hypothetical protein
MIMATIPKARDPGIPLIQYNQLAAAFFCTNSHFARTETKPKYSSEHNNKNSTPILPIDV